MAQSLPAQPSLENLKKQAKSLLKQWKARDEYALRRIRELHPKHGGVSEADFRSVEPKLADCQLAVARELGYDTWSALKRAVEHANAELVDQLLTRGTLHYGGEDQKDRLRATELLRQNPQLASANIWAAAAVGNTEAVADFLSGDSKLANRNGGPRDMPPLLYLCYSRIESDNPEYNPLETATLLLDHGADPNAHFFSYRIYKFTCLTGAIGEGERGLVSSPPHSQAKALAELLLERGADPNDGQGLYNSMFSGGTHWIQLLLDFGLNHEHSINWSKDGTRTLDYLLAHACGKNMVDRVELLLQHGADPNSLDWYDKRSCYEVARSGGNTQVAELLTQYGAEVIEPESAQQRFYEACMAGDRQTVEAMRSEHANDVRSWIATADAKNISRAADAGKTDSIRLMLELGYPLGDALFDVAWHGNLQIAKLLVESGANVRARHAVHFATPVGFADYAGHLEVRDYLLEHDIDLFDTIRFNRPERAAAILAADPSALERPFCEYAGRKPENASHTPLVQAVVAGHVDVVKVLLDHGANRSATHYDGRSILQLATDDGNLAIIALLQDGRAE